MSGGGGGPIIIGGGLRALAGLEIVQECGNKHRLKKLVAKPDREWTKSDMRFVVSCVSAAIKEL